MRYLLDGKEKEKRMEQHKKIIKKVIVIAVVSILITVTIIFAISFKSSSESKNIKLLKQLIENNKNLENFQVTLQTKNELIFDENTTSVETNSVLSNRNNFEKAMYKIHTAGKSTFNNEENFDVTGTFFCVENDVYESVGTEVVASSITYEKFSKMCEEITLFAITDENVESEDISNHEDGIVLMRFDLKSIDKAILSGHLEQYQKTTDNELKDDEVELVSASVSYFVKNEIIVSQELKIQTMLKNSESTSFGFVSRINYVDVDKDFDFKTPTIPSKAK